MQVIQLFLLGGDNMFDEKALLHMQKTTKARIGVGCSGPRPKTQTSLIMRGDHAAARDTVLTDVNRDFLENMGLFTVQTMCRDKEEYLRRPDLGRKFPEESLKYLREHCKFAPQVQVYASDGLSSEAIEANIEDTIPAIEMGLKKYNIKMGTPFFVKYGRVATEDHISELLQCEVVCVLIGERPGLATANSMSAYLCYKATVGMEESRRTVVSNIHSEGFPPAEAGAYIADLILQMLEKKVSGVEFKR